MVYITPKLEKEEIEAAIKRVKLGKAPGVDEVTADEMRAAGTFGMDMLFKFVNLCGRKKKYQRTGLEQCYGTNLQEKKTRLFATITDVSVYRVFASVILQNILKRTDES